MWHPEQEKPMSGYPCPFCGHEGSTVKDTREHFVLALAASTYRRRRECNECQKRFATIEMAETDIDRIVKAEKSRLVDSFLQAAK
jgi:transcriptional regulator NrdR family protein